MRSRFSAGLLMYRRTPSGLEVFLVHPGGPFFKNKDAGAWTIPKGEPSEGEELLAAARREFHEETGKEPKGEFLDLGEIRQKGGKTVSAWAFEGDWEADRPPASNEIEIRWPPGSEKVLRVPEIDRAEFFPCDDAREKINAAQRALIDRLERALES